MDIRVVRRHHNYPEFGMAEHKLERGTEGDLYIDQGHLGARCQIDQTGPGSEFWSSGYMQD